MEVNFYNLSELIGKTVLDAFYATCDDIANNYTWKIYETTRHNTLIDKCYSEGYSNTDEEKRIDNLIVKNAIIKNNTVYIYAREEDSE